jgi:hypothetical protein
MRRAISQTCYDREIGGGKERKMNSGLATANQLRDGGQG